MIALHLAARSDADMPFVTRLAAVRSSEDGESFCLSSTPARSLWCGSHGLFELSYAREGLIGDILLVDPGAGRAERLIRAGSRHNSLLVTEQCDQLCLMCSQPPKKTHRDRFRYFEAACRLADPGSAIGLTGGEPTLHMGLMLAMLERLLEDRPDLAFHILSNGQHFNAGNCERLTGRLRSNIVWGMGLGPSYVRRRVNELSLDIVQHAGRVADRLVDEVSAPAMLPPLVELVRQRASEIHAGLEAARN